MLVVFFNYFIYFEGETREYHYAHTPHEQHGTGGESCWWPLINTGTPPLEDEGLQPGLLRLDIPLSPGSPIEKRRAGRGTPVLRLMLNLRWPSPCSDMVAVMRGMGPRCGGLEWKKKRRKQKKERVLGWAGGSERQDRVRPGMLGAGEGRGTTAIYVSGKNMKWRRPNSTGRTNEAARCELSRSCPMPGASAATCSRAGPPRQ